MEIIKSPFETLFDETIPRLLQAVDEYYALAVPYCSAEKIQLLAELQRRIKQCELLLKNVGAIESQRMAVAMNVLAALARQQPNAEQFYETSCQQMDAMWLFTESFYWVAHKATSVILANHACFQGKRLPGMPVKIVHGGVTNVRNHLIEHPFEYSNTFGLGGMWSGPVLSGGLGKDAKGNKIKDQGLYFNALEWADTISLVLLRASDKLRK